MKEREIYARAGILSRVLASEYDKQVKYRI